MRSFEIDWHTEPKAASGTLILLASSFDEAVRVAGADDALLDVDFVSPGEKLSASNRNVLRGTVKWTGDQELTPAYRFMIDAIREQGIVVWHASLDTRHFSWNAFGRTGEEAFAALRSVWENAKNTGPWHEVVCDVVLEQSYFGGGYQR